MKCKKRECQMRKFLHTSRLRLVECSSTLFMAFLLRRKSLSQEKAEGGLTNDLKWNLR